jgi:hypothetical protein
MKSIFLISVSFLVLVTSSAMAATEVEDIHIVKKDVYIEEDSSEANRINKTLSATWQVFGTGPNNTPSDGFALSYFFNRNSVLMLDWTSNDLSKNSMAWDSLVWQNNDIRATTLGLHFKKFLGNSFYVRAGADYRMVNFRGTNSSGDVSHPVITQFQGHSLAAEAAIGNQWQWSWFTLGCDWVGAVLPFSWNITDGSITSNAQNWDVEQFNTYKADLFYKAVFEGLRFYIGATF